MRKPKEWLFACFSVAISLSLFFSLAEIICRILPVRTSLLPVVAPSQPYHFAPNRPFTFSRDWNFALVNYGRVNNAGFVNNQDYDANDSRPLLAVIGDSFIEAAMVPYPETIQGRLAKSLAPSIRVYSFAASGAALSQYLVWAQLAAREYHATGLIINVVGNDFDESYLGYQQTDGYWLYGVGLDGEIRLRRPEFNRGVFWHLLQQSALIRYVVLNLHAKEAVTNFKWLRALRSDKGTEQAQFIGYTRSALEPERIDASQKVIDAFFRDLPELTGLSPDRIVFTMDGFRYPDLVAAGKKSYFDKMRQAFQERARALGYEVIDGDSYFFPDFSKNHQRFEYPQDGHWNSRAHGLISEAILSSALLKARQVAEGN